MSHCLTSSSQEFPDLTALHQLLELLLTQFSIPSNAKRIAFNFRDTSYYTLRQGFQPVEVQLERNCLATEWQIRFIATFDYPDEQAAELDVALYFNFKYQWFYQPDIKRCELARPEVLSLFKSWQTAFVRSLKEAKFNEQTLSIVSLFNHH